MAAAAALLTGVLCAVPYAKLAAPYYERIARTVAARHPWKVASVALAPGPHTAELQLRAEIRRHLDDANPAAHVVGHVQVGEAVETPVVFWTIMCVWPAASWRRRVLRIFIGVPVFLLLEAMTTATQLMLPMAQASSILAGHLGPTPWDYWSRFLEAGGQFALACCAAILTAARRSCSEPPMGAEPPMGG